MNTKPDGKRFSKLFMHIERSYKLFSAISIIFSKMNKVCVVVFVYFCTLHKKKRINIFIKQNKFRESISTKYARR